MANRKAYIDHYNKTVAIHLSTLEANFHIWANLLSAIHPPQGTIVDLRVLDRQKDFAEDYAERYKFVQTCVRVPGVGCVWHYLEPVGKESVEGEIIKDRALGKGTLKNENRTSSSAEMKSVKKRGIDDDYIEPADRGSTNHKFVNDQGKAKRAIILFRGTAIHPATYRPKRRWLHTEPMGVWADGNLLSVASTSFFWIKSDIGEWMKVQSDIGRDITFVGASLGGTLAMRSLKHHIIAQCAEKKESWKRSALYIYSAPGLSRGAANFLKEKFYENDRWLQLHAFWHVDDWVATTGHYPRTNGREYSQQRCSLSRPVSSRATKIPPDHLSKRERHTLPFVALEEVWHAWLAYSIDSVVGEPKLKYLSHKFRSLLRQTALGMAAAPFISIGKGIQGQVRKLGALLKKEDVCGHEKH
jgi:hypothetical protein